MQNFVTASNLENKFPPSFHYSNDLQTCLCSYDNTETNLNFLKSKMAAVAF